MNERNQELRDLAQRVADALPLGVAEEVVLTGSVSRGVADDLSDIEMLIVTPEPLTLALLETVNPPPLMMYIPGLMVTMAFPESLLLLASSVE